MSFDQHIIDLNKVKSKILYTFRDYDEYMRAYAIADEYKLQIKFYDKNKTTYHTILKELIDDDNNNVAIACSKSACFLPNFAGKALIINRK